MENAELIDRRQPMFLSLEDIVEDKSLVWSMDRFIDICGLKQMNFQDAGMEAAGRPAYASAVLNQLQVYGCANSIRSSRRFEAECVRNVGVMWLTNGLKLRYKAIVEFRKHNLRPLQRLFRRFTALRRYWGLAGGTQVAADGTKVKASNNKKNCFTRKKLKERLKDIDQQLTALFEKAEHSDRLEGAAGTSRGNIRK